MGKVEKYEKLNKPGLWFVCSGQPATELKLYIYDFAVESVLPIVVYSGILHTMIKFKRDLSAWQVLFCVLSPDDFGGKTSQNVHHYVSLAL